ncbi:ACT domain-containing protein [Jiella avicenniae]|uniref:ACT domain-containing protein n=1 Tax=Jiella avicenniae TaxID=2907202 RepID=A0A9X1P393_9HYPH|nr:ACT domain-containing protein [Jiella avicenniae]MCE7029510.1 ACT domain-containing protein [Jiella avicenniae]
MASGTGPKARISVTLRVLAGSYAISRLAPDAAIPDWADGPGFVSIGRTAEELSILCEAERVPFGIRSEPGWSGFRFVGPFAFGETGIAAAVLQPLADAGIGILLVSTFDTDHLFVKTEQAGRAAEALTAAGHVVAPGG